MFESLLCPESHFAFMSKNELPFIVKVQNKLAQKSNNSDPLSATFPSPSYMIYIIYDFICATFILLTLYVFFGEFYYSMGHWQLTTISKDLDVSLLLL